MTYEDTKVIETLKAKIDFTFLFCFVFYYLINIIDTDRFITF